MYRPKRDPFFEELKAEIQAGIDEAQRGEIVDQAEVWASVDATIAKVKSERGISEPG